MNKELRLAHDWWLQVFKCNLVQHHEWFREKQPACHLYCDARGEPPRVAAVLFDGNSIKACDTEPPASLLDTWARRADNQIMGLELLSIALGLSSFADAISGRDVIIWSDNTGAEHATAKGTAKCFDHTCLVHAMWQHFAELKIQTWIERVPTKENIADLPSREAYYLLQDLRAHKVPAVLEDRYLQAQTWAHIMSKWAPVVTIE